MNSQNPYKIEQTGCGYRFETDFGFIYELSFLRYPTINERLEYVLYMFNIEQLRKGKASVDVRIQITIEFVLSIFFENNINAVIVVMDSLDGKHLARKRLFDKWYNKSNKTTIEKYEAACSTEEIEIVTTLFIEKNNPFKKVILSDYYELVKINFYS